MCGRAWVEHVVDDDGSFSHLKYLMREISKSEALQTPLCRKCRKLFRARYDVELMEGEG
jgi:hypothetical protein